jgi:hypothetical protein
VRQPELHYWSNTLKKFAAEIVIAIKATLLWDTPTQPRRH